MVWSTCENSKRNATPGNNNNNNSSPLKKGNVQEDVCKLQNRKLKVSWYYNEIRIAEFNLDSIGDKRYKLVLSVMHQGDEFEILMI